MSKKIGGVTLDQVSEYSLWVVKHAGWRECDTYPNLKKRGSLDSDDIRDIDFLCTEGQPDILKQFFIEFESISKEYGWMTLPEMFDKFGIEDEVP